MVIFMAKEKQPASNEVEPFNVANPSAPVSVDELAALRAENERLKAALADRDAEISAIVSAPPDIASVDPPGRFQVDLTDAPSWVVDAQSAAHAWDAYKSATGVISSIHAPSVSRVSEQTPLGRAAKA